MTIGVAVSTAKLMSSRAAWIVTVSAIGTVLGLAALAGGCSDDDTAKASEPDGGDVADVVQRDAPPAEEAGQPFTRDACLAECAEKFPGGKAKDDAIVACWEGACPGICTPGESDGGVPDAGVDAGSCRNPVTTFDPSCDLCTVTSCCTEWDSCFDDDACASYVACISDCPAE